MKPSPKDPRIAAFLEAQTGRSTAIKAQYCIPPPMGCGMPITEFDNDLERKEYTISGLCPRCQRQVFGGKE
jgi:hypothetical protein